MVLTSVCPNEHVTSGCYRSLFFFSCFLAGIFVTSNVALVRGYIRDVKCCISKRVYS